MMGKRRSDGDDINDDCELKAMLIDKCEMCHANLDTDHHKSLCHIKNDQKNDQVDDGENLTKHFSIVIKLSYIQMTLKV